MSQTSPLNRILDLCKSNSFVGLRTSQKFQNFPSRSIKSSQVHPQDQSVPLMKGNRDPPESIPLTKMTHPNHLPQVLNVQHPNVVAIPQVLSVHQVPQVIAFPFGGVPHQVVQPQMGATRYYIKTTITFASSRTMIKQFHFLSKSSTFCCGQF